MHQGTAAGIIQPVLENNFKETILPMRYFVVLQEAATTVYPIPDGMQIHCLMHFYISEEVELGTAAPTCPQ